MNKFKITHYSGISKESYNNEPVFYCKSCLSLLVSAEEGTGSYCKDCGCASIGRTNIDLWTESYRRKYGKDYLTGLDIPYEEYEHCEHKDNN
jgi:predicted RNA-binding Zn-ribbon protein involved in translation (DUF1610 family)